MTSRVITALCVLLCAHAASAETIRVPAGGSLQAALDSAQPGDVIELQAGVTYTGLFLFPAKAGMVTLTTGGTLPNRRVGPADAPLFATIASPVGMAPADLTDAANWTLDGIRFVANPGGFGENVLIQRGENIVLRRLLIDVPDPIEQKRFILGNGRNITLTQSHCSGVWRAGQDSQCFVAWDGAGPYTITDNFLEAASENVMFGGADSSSPENIPADILIENNHFSKRLVWKGQPRNVKNLFELKAAKRVIVRHNLFERNWADGQAGRAILFTPRNQDGGAPWSVVEDVLFEQNVIRDVALGFLLTGYDNNHPSGQTTRITIRDNDIQADRMAVLVLSQVGRLDIYRNTVALPEGEILISFDVGEIWPAGGVKHLSALAAESMIFAENVTPGTWIHAPLVTGLGAFAVYVGTYALTLAEPPPDPEPPPPVPVVDAEAPVITSLAVAQSGKSHNYTVRATATDNSGSVTLVCTVNGVPSDFSFSAKGKGTYVVVVTATDAAGNRASAQTAVQR